MMAKYYCSHADCPTRWRSFRAKASTGAAKCPSCSREATLVKKVESGLGPYVLPEFPEHYNISMGCIVKSRAHHRQLQKERGLRDYEPVKNSPSVERLRREGLL